MKRLFLFAVLSTAVIAQNVMIFPDLSTGSNSQIQVSVEVENTDSFVGFQLDLPLGDELEYMSGTAALTTRANGHAISANIIGDNTLRVFAYSLSQVPFNGSEGAVCTFTIETATIPGTYSLIPVDPIIGDANSVNMTSVTNGQVVLSAPDIDVSPQTLNYDRVPLTGYADRSFTIYNQGNANLDVSSIISSHLDFEVLGASTRNISGGSSESVTVRFHSNTKGTYAETITIQSDDPDEPSQTVQLDVIAYAVNELDINSMFGRSGHSSTMTIDIANMEPFVGFSFDLQLPSVMTYSPATVQLTSRAADHVVDATTLENGNVRIVAYSPSNAAFTGSEGDVVELDFDLDGQGGHYSIQFTNPVIGDANSDNILSDHYSGSLEIASPDLSVNQNSFNYGEVSIFDTAQVDLTISNYGSDTLDISSLESDHTSFWTETSTPLSINPSSNLSIPIYYHNALEGSYTGSLRIRSNDPDEDPTDISLNADVFIPNIMRIDHAIITAEDAGWVEVSIENNEPFVGCQFDITLPPEVTFLGEAILTARATDHVLSVTESTPGHLSVITYSLSQTEFSGQDGPFVRFTVEASPFVGEYGVFLSDVIIGNDQSENVMSSFENGIIQIVPIIKTNTLSMNAGWNLLSWDVDTENDSLEYLLSDILTDVNVVLGFEGEGLTYDPDWPQFSSLQLMDHFHGYWVRTDVSSTLDITGATVPDSMPITLEEGWDLVSYLPDDSDIVAHALESIYSDIIMVLGFDAGGLTYDPDWPQFSNLEVLSPGFGYWIKVNQATTLIYPNSQASETLSRNSPLQYTGIKPTREWVSVLGNVNTPEGSVIQARDPQGTLCGGTIVTEAGYYGMISVYRDDPETDLDEGAQPGDEIGLYVNGVEQSEHVIWGEFGDVNYLDLTPLTTGEPLEYALSANYPNPFNPSTKIHYQLPTAEHIRIEVYNSLGQHVRSLQNGRKPAGHHEQSWDGKDTQGKEMPSGVYFCRMVAGTFTQNQKMIILH